VVKKPHITVAGAINDDILARSGQRLNLHDSNPGTVTRRIGGVGLNIARNLMLLGSDVRFISAVGSGFREQMLPDDGAGRLSADRIVHVPGCPSATYVALHGHDGDMTAAVSDMRIYDELDPACLAKAIADVNVSDALVIDANLNDRTLFAVTDGVTVPIVSDPVSIAKSTRIRPYLAKLSLFKPNAEEAGALLGFPVQTITDAMRAARAFIALGVGVVCLSLSRQGMILADRREMIHVQGRPRRIENATGAGDAMLAALTFALCRGTNLRKMGELAVAASLITLEHDEAVNPRLPDCFSEDVRGLVTIKPLYD